MAQLVERQAVNLQVAGSSPAGGDHVFAFSFAVWLQPAYPGHTKSSFECEYFIHFVVSFRCFLPHKSVIVSIMANSGTTDANSRSSREMSMYGTPLMPLVKK